MSTAYIYMVNRTTCRQNRHTYKNVSKANSNWPFAKRWPCLSPNLTSVYDTASSSPPFLCLLHTFRGLVGKTFCLCEWSKLLPQPCVLYPLRGEGRTDCPSCQERGWSLCLGALPFSLPQCLKSLLSDFSLSKSCRDPATSTLEAEEGGCHCINCLIASL